VAGPSVQRETEGLSLTPEVGQYKMGRCREM
jgi:hypothetical protein